MAETEELELRRQALGRQLRLHRKAAGYSQHGLAPLTNYARSTIANVEVGRQNVPRDFWGQCDELLGADGALVAGFNAMDDLRQGQLRHNATSEAADLDTPLDIVRRLQSAGASNVDEMALVQVEAIVERVIRDYERLGPHALVPRVLAHRRWLHEVMQGRQPPKYAARLHLSAARLCGVLAVIALDMQQRDVARAYALEAFQLADLVDDADTQAWVRATQSLVEYYIGDYEQALFYASAGRQLASTGSQAIRLAINGEARAHARLGNHRAAASAVDRALQGLADQPKVNEVSCGLSLTPYCAARVSSNAATAYLLLGNAEQVMIHGQAALAVFDGSELRGPQALTRLDMAMALVHDTHPQPERAAGLAEDAVAVDGAGVFASVAQRASEFLIAVAEWHDVPAIRDVTARVHDLAGRNRRSA